MSINESKVLYIFCSTNYSGAEIVLERLITNNKNTIPFAMCPPGQFAQNLKKNGINVIYENALSSLNRTNKTYNKLSLIFTVFIKIIKINYHILKIKKHNKINIIHSNNLTAATYTLPCIITRKLWFRSCKFIWSKHDISYPDGEISSKLASFCIKKFDLTLAVSSAVKLIETSKLQKKIQILYNGLDTNNFKFDSIKRNKFRLKYKLNEYNLTLGIVGLISERKGHLDLLEVFELIISKHPNIKLLVIGRYNTSEPDYKKTFEKKLHTIKNITLLPFTNDVVSAYCGIDVLINCSLPELSEPLGTTIYEAMSCERLVLASNTGGSPEIIDDGKDGFLFKAGDKEDLINKLQLLIKNEASLDIITKNARKKVLNKFSIQNMVNNYNTILARLK